MNNYKWKCNRCKSIVDYENKKCNCTTSPSPWYQVKVKKPKQDVIRIGDKVEIINPEVFKRVGYNLTTADIIENYFTTEQKQLLNDLMVSAGYNTKSIFTIEPKNDPSELEYSFAKLVLRAKRWGGPERTVHTKLEPKYLNSVGTVISKRYVKTGIYCSASGSYTYDEEYDYEPAYLENEETVGIYSVDIFNGGYEDFPQDSVAKITEEDYYEITFQQPANPFCW